MACGGDKLSDPCTNNAKEGIVGLMKRLAVGFVVITLVTALTSGLGARSAAAAEFAYGQEVSVSTDFLNLRSGSSLDSAVIDVLPYGTTGTIAAGPFFADGYDWYYLNLGSQQGWVAGEFLAAADSSGGDSNGPRFNRGDGVRVTALSLNVRDAPGLSGSVYTTVPEGTVFTIASDPTPADGYTWYQVHSFGVALPLDGNLGWVAGEFLAFDPGVSGCEGRGPCPTGLEPGDGVRVVTDALNFRDAPGLSSNVAAVLDQGTVGVVAEGLTYLDGYVWIAITTNTHGTGWVARDFIVGDPSVVGAPEFAAGTMVQVTGGALNLRSLPTLASDVEAVMADGATLTVADGPILSDGYTWYQVTSDQYGTGWVAGEFLAEL